MESVTGERNGERNQTIRMPAVRMVAPARADARARMPVCNDVSALWWRVDAACQVHDAFVRADDMGELQRMNRREFMRLAVAAVMSDAIVRHGDDPEIAVALMGSFCMASDYELLCGQDGPARYYWVWRDRGVTYHSYGTERLEPTDNPFLFRARLSRMRAMLAANLKGGAA